MHVATKTGWQLDTPAGAQSLIDEARRVGAEVVIIDALNRVHSREENSATEMKSVLLCLERLRREAGCAVIVVHHFRKAGGIGTSKRGGQNLRGASALHAWLDAALYVYPTKRRNQVKIVAEGKDGAADPFLLELDGEREVSFRYLGEAEPDRATDMKERVFAAIVQLELDGVLPTQARIAEAVGLTGAGVRSHLEALRAGGRVTKEQERLGRGLANIWRSREASAD